MNDDLHLSGGALGWNGGQAQANAMNQFSNSFSQMHYQAMAEAQQRAAMEHAQWQQLAAQQMQMAPQEVKRVSPTNPDERLLVLLTEEA
jgi:hypothetical protein